MSTDNFRDYLLQELVDDYTENRLSRRDAIARLAGLTGGTLAATALIDACASTKNSNPTPDAGTSGPTPVVAGPGVSPDDPAIVAQAVDFPGPEGTLFAYTARPKGNGPFAGVLVCHENRGLIEPNRDIARRFAKGGYAALALDLLSRDGGTDRVDPAQVPGILGMRSTDLHVADFQAAFSYLAAQPSVKRGAIGMTGFCFGGGVTWSFATKNAELKAAVPFYGRSPPLTDAPAIRAAVLAMYAERDTNITSRAGEIEMAMRDNGKVFEKIIYPNAQHAFFNDLNGDRYDPVAAKDAWEKTLAWFGRYLS